MEGCTPGSGSPKSSQSLPIPPGGVLLIQTRGWHFKVALHQKAIEPFMQRVQEWLGLNLTPVSIIQGSLAVCFRLYLLGRYWSYVAVCLSKSFWGQTHALHACQFLLSAPGFGHTPLDPSWLLLISTPSVWEINLYNRHEI